MYTSALKTIAHGRRSALKTKPRDSVWSFRTSVYFYVYKVAMRTNSRSLVATIITYILTANGDFLTSVKAHKSRRKEFDLVYFQRRIKMAINIWRRSALLYNENIDYVCNLCTSYQLTLLYWSLYLQSGCVTVHFCWKLWTFLTMLCTYLMVFWLLVILPRKWLWLY